ncbi:hypothetical protein U1872_04355 [Sphingomonas sp. RB3P16]
MSRISNYTIMADLDHAETLLLHGYSGAWDIVTHDAARSLRQRRKDAPFIMPGKLHRGDVWPASLPPPGRSRPRRSPVSCAN